MKAKVIELAGGWSARQALIEEAGAAIALLDELRFVVAGVAGIKPDKDKVARMAIVSARFEAGQIFLPEHASWLPELEAELFAFPGSKYDDQVDFDQPGDFNKEYRSCAFGRCWRQHCLTAPGAGLFDATNALRRLRDRGGWRALSKGGEVTLCC